MGGTNTSRGEDSGGNGENSFNLSGKTREAAADSFLDLQSVMISVLIHNIQTKTAYQTPKFSPTKYGSRGQINKYPEGVWIPDSELPQVGCRTPGNTTAPSLGEFSELHHWPLLNYE